MVAPKNLKFIRKLSGGCNNDGVVLLLDRDSGIYYVEKSFKNRNLKHAEHSILEYLHSHPHIVHVRRSPNPDALLTEFCDLGTLEAVIHRAHNTGALVPEEFLLKVVADVLSALAWAHQGIDTTAGPNRLGYRARGSDPLVHTDVHEGNILLHSVSRSVYPRAVLGDWGNARSPGGEFNPRRDMRMLAETVRDFVINTRMPPFIACRPLLDILFSRRLDAVDMFSCVVQLQRETSNPRKLSSRILILGHEVQPLKTAEPAEGPLRDGGGIYGARRHW